MTDNVRAEEQLQRLYNQTKNKRSPVDLDDLILGKIRVLEEKPAPVTPEKLGVYLPIAASILLVFLLQSYEGDKAENRGQKPLEVVQLPIEKKRQQPKVRAGVKQQLPELFFLPSEDINNKVVRACNGILAIPGEGSEITVPEGASKERTKEKTSDLPMQPIYPNDLRHKTPECQQISNQIFNP